MKQSQSNHAEELKKKSWVPVILLVVALAALSSCGSSGDGSPATGPGGGTAKELNSADLGPGGKYEHTFAVAGTFPYHCKHHAPMAGSVVVSASAASSLVNVSIASASMAFPAASVKPGGKVIWTNNTAMVHTVTSN